VQDSEPNPGALAAALFAAIAALVGWDLVGDYLTGTGIAHVGSEAAGVILALGGVGWFAARAMRQRSALRRERDALRDTAENLAQRLSDEQRERERWQGEARQLLEGLGSAIDQQFERWGLTRAEREVALLLLKGLSHKEVADVRGVSERTVRQQARALYKKAGLEGRADLAAYFLEDLLLPPTGAGGPDAS
jgi:DNA-binding CsgD family transcriptional regulator